MFACGTSLKVNRFMCKAIYRFTSCYRNVFGQVFSCCSFFTVSLYYHTNELIACQYIVVTAYQYIVVPTLSCIKIIILFTYLQYKECIITYECQTQSIMLKLVLSIVRKHLKRRQNIVNQGYLFMDNLRRNNFSIKFK